MSSAGPAGEDVFLAPQAVVAEEAPLISPVQSLPTVRPCPYTDVRLKDAAEKALHVGVLMAYPESSFGHINYVGGGGLSPAVEDVGVGVGGLPSGSGLRIPAVD